MSQLPKRYTATDPTPTDAITYLLASIIVGDHSVTKTEKRELVKACKKFGLPAKYSLGVLSIAINDRIEKGIPYIQKTIEECVLVLKKSPQITIDHTMEAVEDVIKADGVISKNENKVYHYLCSQFAK